MKKQSNSSSKIQPLADRCLIRREDVIAEKSPSGIIIPDTAKQEKSKIGTVIAIGPGRMSDDGKIVATSVKVGVKVIFNSGWDNEVDTGDEKNEYFLVKESDILAVIK